MVGAENASDSRPTTISIHVTNRPKLSADDDVEARRRCGPRAARTPCAAPTRPIAPSGPIGIRSPGERNASATIAAMAAAVTHSIGTMAFKEPSWLGIWPSGPPESASPEPAGAHLIRPLAADRRLDGAQEQIRQHAHQDRRARGSARASPTRGGSRSGSAAFFSLVSGP